MPRFDGTGPRGTGPLTGRGEGYCILELPEQDRPARGYVGLQGTPVCLEAPASRPAPWRAAATWRGPVLGRRRGLAARRGRGRRLPRW
jgi:hypothetical protein